MINLAIIEKQDGTPVTHTAELYEMKCEKCGNTDHNLEHLFCSNCGAEFKGFEKTKDIPNDVKLFVF